MTFAYRCYGTIICVEGTTPRYRESREGEDCIAALSDSWTLQSTLGSYEIRI
jgi:hypothetical protein